MADEIICLQKPELSASLREQLDEIDATIKKAAWDGYYWSRLNILIGMWEKGRAIVSFTPLNDTINWSSLERETTRQRKALKRWHDLYLKHKDRELYIEIAKQAAEKWTDRAFREALPASETPLLPPSKFAIIYADPPWQYSNTGFDESAQSQYPTLKNEEIINLKDASDKTIFDLATDFTVLFLWATNPLIPEAIDILNGWNFEYKTNMAWIKDRGRGKGWWLKSKHELLFIGVKLNSPKPQIRLDSCFEAVRSKTHSKKPIEVYDFIEAMYPGPLDETFYLELFARETRKGWKAWGNEINETTKII